MKKKIFWHVLFILSIFLPIFAYGAIPAQERAALIELYNSTNGDNWTNNSGWKDGTLEPDGFGPIGSESTWYGITVEDIGGEDYVTKIDLYDNNLIGSIPTALGNLSNLLYLNLWGNELSGAIPPELGNLSNLLDLNLGGNELSDAIPSEIGNLSNLKFLNLGGNNLSGTIPAEIGNLSKLEVLALSGNNLSGTIPAGIFDLINLESLRLGSNDLIIELADFAKLNNLKSLHLRSSNLTGTIPGEFFTLVNLERLYLRHNRFSGDIPTGFGSLVNLKILELEDTKFSGSIPGELFNLINLRLLDLSWNKLFGNIPEELGNLVNLGKLYLDHNDLGGEIPTSLTNLSKLSSPHVDIGYNCLYTNNPGLRAWLDSVDPDWESHQNECTSHTLYIKSTPATGVDVTVSPNDINGNGNGSTNFTRIYNPGTLVTLTAPAIHNDKSFLKWVVDGVDNTSGTITVTMDSDHTAQAVYQASTYTLTVRSSPDPDVPITVTPPDNNDLGNGNTEFFRTYNYGTNVTLTAPSPYYGKNFVKWLIDGTENSSQTVEVIMDSSHTAHAVYQSAAYTLTVQSAPTGIGITVTPSDNNGNGDGNTDFTRTYYSGTLVTLTAPSSSDNNNFIKWTVDGNDNLERAIQISMDSNHKAVAYYVRPPEISVNRSTLYFAYIYGSNGDPTETFTVYNSGGGTLNWSATTEKVRISLNPTTGINWGTVEVKFNPENLAPYKFYGGPIYVSDPLASNSPFEVKTNLWVKSKSSPPFGEFSTPLDGSTVSGSVPVTGWVIGDTGIESVKIYREEDSESGLVYIGDAVLVEGARPDIETAYPYYPMNHKAGWGYMMLTNFLPNGGNGTLYIHAKATDKEGNTASLGVKTITVDNANAVKPFGAIDTPAAGGTASGSNYRNQGWILTPLPNKIPEDGSTINVYIDGVNKGHPVYSVYRSDIAELFPGYVNSDGAGGYFNFDTTTIKKTENGMHTIEWSVTDDAGNTAGIGSRYFSIQNPQGARRRTQGAKFTSIGGELQELVDIPVDYSIPVGVVKGYRPDAEPRYIYPDQNGKITIEITQLGRVEIRLMPIGAPHDTVLQRELISLVKWEGYQVVGTQLKPLPIGSTLDIQQGIFYWQPGVGFLKDYEFVFIKTRGNETNKTRVKVTILPE
jgi:Leucine-rich repeat (LRR) protein